MPDSIDNPEGTPSLHELKISGETRQVSLDELKTMAAKAGGADERFREASNLKKEADDLLGKAKVGVELQDVYRKVAAGTSSTEDDQRYCELMGCSYEEFVAAKQGEPAPVTEPTTTDTLKQIGLSDLAPDLQGLIRGLQDTSNYTRNVTFMDSAKQAVSDNENLGKLLEVAGPEKSGTIIPELVEMVRGEVSRRQNSGAKYGPRLLEEATAAVENRVSKLGIQPQTPSNTPTGGLGDVGTSLPIDVQVDEPIERVPNTDPNYTDNFVKRFYQKIAKAETA